MKIFTRLFTLIGFSVVLSLIMGVVIGLMSDKKPKMPEKFVLVMDFNDQLGSALQKGPFAKIIPSSSLNAFDIAVALDRAAQDPRVLGFAADVSSNSLDISEIEEMRAALARFASSGKFTSAWADSFGELGPATKDYWLASAFKQVNLQPLGMVGLAGPSISMPFAREALDKVGVEPNVYRRHEFKSAMDSLNDKELSAPVRENYTKLISDIYTTISTGIAANRNIKPETLQALIEQSPLDDETAKSVGLIDNLIYRMAWIKKLSDDNDNAPQINISEYMESTPYSVIAGDKTRPLGTVALISIDGPIIRGYSDSGGLGRDQTSGAHSIASYIEEASNDTDISYILLRINSPGGSVAASETIHNALLAAKEKGKKVIVSMAGIAASGGYWIATPADRIFANASSITGSIGVVAGKFNFAGLSEKLGIHWENIGTTANSTMWAPNTSFTDEQAKTINNSMDRTYTAFLKRVEDGRKIAPDMLDALARGRVWTGYSAQQLGLVDEIGGMFEAITYIKHELGGDERSKITLRPIPMPRPPIDKLIETLESLYRTPNSRGASFGLFDLVAKSLLLRMQNALGLTSYGMAQLPIHVEVQ